MNYYLSILLAFCLNGCVSFYDSNINSSNISGIVRASGNYSGRVAYRHKYLNNSIKALPLLMTTGKVEKTGEFFVEIDFRSYSKNKVNNFKYIDLYNSKGDRWEWEVYEKNIKVTKKRQLMIESYTVRIDSKIRELIKFFNDDAVYLKIIGDVNNFKRLDKQHIASILSTLEYSQYLSQI